MNAEQILTNPEELGKARFEMARQAREGADWKEVWKEAPAFPFNFGTCWKHCVQYSVADFASEVGFYIDVLGFNVNSFSESYAMFTGPDRDFYFSIVPVSDGSPATDPRTFQLEFMITELDKTLKLLEGRGVKIEQNPRAYEGIESLQYAKFHTPNGIEITLWEFAPEQG